MKTRNLFRVLLEVRWSHRGGPACLIKLEIASSLQLCMKDAPATFPFVSDPWFPHHDKSSAKLGWRAAQELFASPWLANGHGCTWKQSSYISKQYDSLRAWRFVDRIPVGARFSALVQIGVGAHPAFYTITTKSFPGVKRPELGVNHPPHLALRLKKEWVYTYTNPLCLHGRL
jgi:hypothetical protein